MNEINFISGKIADYISTSSRIVISKILMKNMEGPRRESQNKKTPNEVTPYPVTFELDEIKENTAFRSNSNLKPSHENIINQAINFHLQGNIKEQFSLNKL